MLGLLYIFILNLFTVYNAVKFPKPRFILFKIKRRVSAKIMIKKRLSVQIPLYHKKTFFGIINPQTVDFFSRVGFNAKFTACKDLTRVYVTHLIRARLGFKGVVFGIKRIIPVFKPAHHKRKRKKRQCLRIFACLQRKPQI